MLKSVESLNLQSGHDFCVPLVPQRLWCSYWHIPHCETLGADNDDEQVGTGRW